jgi:hypothetical protein
MRAVIGTVLAACLAMSACRFEVPRRPTFSPTQASAVADSARTFLEQVASGVTREGPAAWRRYFTDSAFFMASEGQLVFSSGAAAAQGIQALTHLIRRIELTWGDSLRIDPIGPGFAVVGASYREVRVDTAGHRVDEAGYFTGLAEHRPVGWQLRDAHWSVLVPASAVR